MKGVEQEKENILWFPVIDEEKCTGCSRCLEFCPHTVYQLRQRSKVKNLYDCVVYCSTGKGLFPEKTIAFPDMEDEREFVKRLNQ